MPKDPKLPALPGVAKDAPSRLETLEDLAAGQFWRTRKKIAAVKSTYTRYESETGWLTDGRDALPKGTVLLVKSLRYIDGNLHTVILAPHPLEEHQNERRFLAEDFYKCFERALDAEQVRGDEIETLQGEITRLQQEVITGPQDLPALAAPRVSPDVGALINRADQAEEMKRQANQLVQISEATQKWVTERVEDLGDKTKVLARFYQERSVAAMASAEDTIRYAKKLEAGVQTLGLYTGEGVIVTQLADGAEADPAAPLTLYQRKLYMDEEWVVHLKSGGADADDLPAFAEALSQDRDLLTRILPAERSVVIMRYRRHDKVYFKGSSSSLHEAIGAALANAAANEKNHETFLLIRNGEKVFQVYSELGTDDAPRLFPTTEEVEKLFRIGASFRGLEAREVTPEDVTYTDSLAKHEKVALFYRRLLILLWGLNDRLELFGDFYDRATYDSWLSLEFQQDRFHFIHDDEGALVHHRPSFAEWAREMNSKAQAGSRFVALWNKAANPDTAPAIGKWYRNKYHEKRGVSHRYEPIEKTGFVIARKKGKEVVTSVACRYAGWRNDISRREIEATVSITEYLKEERHHWQGGFLCLDAAKAADLDYYINSRHEREGYLDYIDLFIAARNQLREEEAEAAPFIAALKEAALAAKVGASEDIDAAIDEAIRLWRAAGGGRRVPRPGNKDYNKILKEIAAQVWRLAGKDTDHISAAEKAARKAHRTPLRLAAAGNGRLYLYTSLKADETIELGFTPPWVARLEAKPAKSGRITLGKAKLTRLEEDPADEKILHDWPSAAPAIEACRYAKRLEPGSLLALPQETARAVPFIELLAGDNSLTDETFIELLGLHDQRISALSKRGYLYEPDLMVPLAALRTSRKERGNLREFTSIICLVGPFSRLLWARATPAQRNAFKIWAESRYAKPQRLLSHIETDVEKNAWLRLYRMNLAEAAEKMPGLAAASFLPGDDACELDPYGCLPEMASLEEALLWFKGRNYFGGPKPADDVFEVHRQLPWLTCSAELWRKIAAAWAYHRGDDLLDEKDEGDVNQDPDDDHHDEADDGPETKDDN